MFSEATTFEDEYSNLHERGSELGRGGQGVVFRTRDPDVAIKLALDGNGRSVAYAGYLARLRRVRALPVPRRLHLSAPMAVLKDTAGYVMRLLNGMEPFSTFFAAPSAGLGRGNMPAWLSSMPPELAQRLLAYRDTGGLHRRLVALYKCSTVLARLHGAGLVYGDVSPANAFLSRDPVSRDVWLIDADNLRYEMSGSRLGVYTPSFGAPELVQGLDGGRPRTDCHAFAVMAFWMLTSLHPFIGALVEEGGDGDWADEDDTAPSMDDKAYAGLLPWILDEDDDRNCKDNGLAGLVLTDELLRLFQETFGRGRTKPWMRPAMFHWPVALARAADQAIPCPGCGMGYYFDFGDAAQRCPFCEVTRPRALVVTAYHWLGQRFDAASPAWQLAQPWTPGSPNPVLPHRLFYPFSVTESDHDVLELNAENDELRLSCCDPSRTHRLAFADGHDGDDAFVEFEESAALPLTALTRGFWIRVAGPWPRVLQCIVRGGGQ